MIETVAQTTTGVSQTVTTMPGTGSAYLLKPAKDWTWGDLRDYVITETEARFGSQDRNAAREAGIMKAFIDRHGIEDAVFVAMAAFAVYNGTWRNAPITISRFTKGNDPYFAQVILGSVAH